MKSRLHSFLLLFVSFLLLGLAAISCEESDPVVLNPSLTPSNGDSGSTQVDPYLNVSVQTLAFNASSNEPKTFTVSSNVAYQLSRPSQWVTVANQENDYTVSVTDNPNEEVRQDSIVITAASLRRVVYISQAAKAVVYTLSVDKTTLSVGAEASTAELNIIGNDVWTATTTDEWISLSADKGTGDKKIELSMPANEQPSSRNGKLTVKGEKSGTEVIVSVSQAGTEYHFSVDKTSITSDTSLPFTDSFTISTNDKWTITNDDWIDVSMASGSQDQLITVNLKDNATPEERKGSITITPTHGGSSATIAVTQPGKYLHVSPESLDFPGVGGKKTITVETDGKLSVSKDKDWIEYSTSGNKVTVTLAENPDNASRAGSITISMKDLASGSLSRTVAITQASGVIDLNVSTSLIEVPSAATTVTFSIMTTDDWTIEPSDAWIELNTTSGSGNAVITVNLAENTTPNDETGSIVIKGTHGHTTKTITVKQYGKYLKVSPETLEFPGSGGKKTITVDTDGKLTVTADQDWITYTTGGNKVTVTVAANSGTSSRSGKITISMKDLTVGSLTRTVTVNQGIGNYTLDLSCTQIDVPSSATTETFTITSNDNWTIEPDEPWIVVSPSSGSGNSQISVSLSENTTANDSYGQISVKGTASGVTATVDVIQRGKYLTVSSDLLEFDVSGGSKTFTVSTDGHLAPPTCTESWMSVTTQAGNKVKVTVERNTTTSNRMGVVNISMTGLTSGSLTCMVTVIQKGSATSSAFGHDYVDLDLPSGLKWATCNVGADSPEKYGNYYAWGETEPKSLYVESTYFDSQYTKYNNENGKTTLEPEDDVAHVKWGGDWRMPTYNEWSELASYCNFTPATVNGVSGVKVSKKSDSSVYIFLPYAGTMTGAQRNDLVIAQLWTNSLYWEYSYDAIAFDCIDTPDFYFTARFYGLPVRPVIMAE